MDEKSALGYRERVLRGRAREKQLELTEWEHVTPNMSVRRLREW